MVIGNKESFAIEFELFDKDFGEFKFILGEKEITSFEQDGDLRNFKGRLTELVEWLKDSLDTIFDPTPTSSPLPLYGRNMSEKEAYKNSVDFIFHDENEELVVLENYAEWMFNHSWLSARSGGFLSNLIFCSLDNEWLEISWDNENLYFDSGVKFIYEKGCAYIQKEAFEKVINELVTVYNKELVNS